MFLGEVKKKINLLESDTNFCYSNVEVAEAVQAAGSTLTCWYLTIGIGSPSTTPTASHTKAAKMTGRFGVAIVGENTELKETFWGIAVGAYSKHTGPIVDIWCDFGMAAAAAV